jgi:hypothetical protein
LTPAHSQLWIVYREFVNSSAFHKIFIKLPFIFVGRFKIEYSPSVTFIVHEFSKIDVNRILRRIDFLLLLCFQRFIIFLDNLFKGIGHEYVAYFLDLSFGPLDLFAGPFDLLIDDSLVCILVARLDDLLRFDIFRPHQHPSAIFHVVSQLSIVYKGFIRTRRVLNSATKPVEKAAIFDTVRDQ